jgi:hypothetical protein
MRAVEMLRLSIEGLVRSQPDERRLNVRENLEGLTTIAATFETARAGIARDPELTPLGREKATAKAARDAFQKLAAWEAANVTSLTDRRIAPAEALVLGRSEVKRPSDPGERIAYELRVHSLREELRQLDPLAREAIYLSATDPLVVDACETSPPVVVRGPNGTLPQLVPFVSEERRAAQAIARARAAAPEAVVAELEELVALRSIYTGQLAAIRRDMAELSPGSAADDIERLAGHGTKPAPKPGDPIAARAAGGGNA